MFVGYTLWPFCPMFMPFCGVFYALLWRFLCPFVAFFGKKWPKVAKSGKKVAIFGKILGKKWPILSRMGELLKGSFFGVFWGVFVPPPWGVAQG